MPPKRSVAEETGFPRETEVEAVETPLTRRVTLLAVVALGFDVAAMTFFALLTGLSSFALILFLTPHILQDFSLIYSLIDRRQSFLDLKLRVIIHGRMGFDLLALIFFPVFALFAVMLPPNITPTVAAIIFAVTAAISYALALWYALLLPISSVKRPQSPVLSTIIALLSLAAAVGAALDLVGEVWLIAIPYSVLNRVGAIHWNLPGYKPLIKFIAFGTALTFLFFLAISLFFLAPDVAPEDFILTRLLVAFNVNNAVARVNAAAIAFRWSVAGALIFALIIQVGYYISQLRVKPQTKLFKRIVGKNR